MMNRKMRTRGMTFIEITIALLIIGGFLAFVMPRLFRALTGSQVNNTKMALSNVKVQVVQYHTDTHQYPNRLRDLVTRPSDARVWKGPYIDEDGLYDGWGNEFVYRQLSAGGKRPFELYSWGPNGDGAPQEEWVNVWDL